MKILSRDFTTKEKVLLLILGLILVALSWYRFILIPCREGVEAANAERDRYASELVVAQTKEAQLRKMQQELDNIGELNNASRMESYNNSKQELTLLNGILENALDYSINFSGVTRDGDQIRRNFTLTFQTGSFAAAQEIIRRLAGSEYRCLLGDMQYNAGLYRLGEKETALVEQKIDGVRYGVQYNMSTTATFFETLYGGTPDDGLPADKPK